MTVLLGNITSGISTSYVLTLLFFWCTATWEFWDRASAQGAEFCVILFFGLSSSIAFSLLASFCSPCDTTVVVVVVPLSLVDPLSWEGKQMS